MNKETWDRDSYQGHHPHQVQMPSGAAILKVLAGAALLALCLIVIV